MNRSASSRSRPFSTRTTAGLRLSYRTRPGTAPKYSNASTWPSKNASCAWVANATWNARPEHDSRITNIHSLISARRMRLRDRDLDLVQAQFGAAAGDIPRHRHLSQDRAMFGHQPLPDPPGGMPLLTRYLPVGQQPRIDHRRITLDGRPRPRRINLPRRR